jgi:hypothetical protein
VGILVATLALVAAAAPASASVIDSQPGQPVGTDGWEGGAIDFRDAGGESNVVSIDVPADYAALQVQDTGAALSPSGDCVSTGPHAATCDGRDPRFDSRSVSLHLGDGDDRYTATGAPLEYLVIDGGPGDDVVHVAAGSSGVADIVLPGFVAGGPGNDRLELGAGDSNLWETAASGLGDGGDYLSGGEGNDTLGYPKGGGADGLDGDDTIVATRGAPGLLSCGGGDDTVLADSPGSHSSGGGIYRGELDDCEHVRYICHVPRLKGRTLDAAERAPKRGHCKVRRMAVHGSGPHRVVSGQKPRAGTQLGVRGRVSLVVRADHRKPHQHKHQSSGGGLPPRGWTGRSAAIGSARRGLPRTGPRAGRGRIGSGRVGVRSPARAAGVSADRARRGLLA